MARSLSLRSRINSVLSMKQLHRLVVLFVACAALLMTACEVAFDYDEHNPSTPPSPDIPSDGKHGDPGFGIKPTVPLKRRPIVPTTKLPRPRIIEHISWTAAGTLSVALKEDATAVVTIVERDGTLRSYVADGRVVEVFDIPEEAFELQIDVAEERYTVVVE